MHSPTKKIRVFISPDDYEATFDVDSGHLIEVLIFPCGRSSNIQEIPVSQLDPHTFNVLRTRYHDNSNRRSGS